jgi:DNA polymerase
MAENPSTRAVLDWYLEAGVDECVGEIPVDQFAQSAAERPQNDESAAARPQHDQSAADRPLNDTTAALAPAGVPANSGLAEEPAAFAPSPLMSHLTPPLESTGARPAMPAPAAPPRPANGAVQTAYALAAAAQDVEALRHALAGFDDCPLKKTATNLVFFDGNPSARLVFIGEAPGAEEDRQGLPFVGPSGRLLDRMLASIGLDRSQVLIANTVFWRPPGNRNPTTTEMAMCLPFVERLIELVDPVFLVTLGGAAAKSLLARPESVGRLRGQWLSYATPGLSRPVQARVMYHPAYLLRTPAQKRQAWGDMMEIKRKLDAT